MKEVTNEFVDKQNNEWRLCCTSIHYLIQISIKTHLGDNRDSLASEWNRDVPTEKFWPIPILHFKQIPIL